MTATLTRPAPTPSAPIATPRRPGFRVDIQGLRAVAVLLVVLYHAHVPALTGGYVGVDVFFVISGFLITGQIVREFERTGRLDLFAFYARRMRRLLPAALLVIVTTVVVARFFGPLLQIKATATDGLWSAIYAINFRLSAEGVDYQHANAAPSPMQHLWSLAVEEQFYLVWPLLAIVATLLVRRYRPRALRPVLAVVALAGVCASLRASQLITATSAPTAYFSVQTRAWEFGFGALVALGVPLLVRLPRWLGIGGSWLGLALVVGAAFGYDDATAFPGTAALVPVAGAALFILCGTRTRDGFDRAGAVRALAVRPVQWIGLWSYSWYLWHWPVLVLAPAILGHRLTWQRNLDLMVLALWVAALTYALVEKPTQRSALRTVPWLVRGLALSGVGALVATVLPLVGTTSPSTGYAARTVELRDPVSASTLQALLVASSNDHPVPSNLQPALQDAAKDVPVTQSGCHLDFLQLKQGACVYGDLTARRTLVIFGDSHAQQWDSALINAGTRHHWRIVNWTKAACPAADVSLRNPLLKRVYTECDTWRQATIRRIGALHPNLVLVSQSDTIPGGSMDDGYWARHTVATMRALAASGVRTALISDTPILRGDVPNCLAAHLKSVYPCEFTRKNAYASPLYTTRHRIVASTVRRAGYTVIDPVGWLCSPTVCPVTVGNRLVYRDDSHLTDSFSAFLWPLMSAAVEPLMNKQVSK